MKNFGEQLLRGKIGYCLRGRQDGETGKQTLDNSKKGFTLVELIVVLAISAILLALIVVGILKYQEYANFKRNQEYARTIFNATQASLANSRARGELEDIQDAVDVLMNQDTDPGVGESPFITNEHQKMYYLMITKENYQSLAEAGENSAAGILYNILLPYIPNKAIFNAAICVELDPLDGVVQSVFYCDRENALAYADAAGTVSSGTLCLGAKGNIRDKDNRSKRKKCALGYYGTDTSAEAPRDLDSLVVSKVELRNHEVLELVWAMKKGSQNQEMAMMNYAIDLYKKEENSEKKYATITLENENRNLQSYQYWKDSEAKTAGEDSKSNTVKAKVTFYDEDENELYTDQELDFEAYLTCESGINYAHLVLDAVDQSLLYKTMDNLGLLATTEGKKGQGLDSENVLEKLYGSNSNSGNTTDKDTLKNSYSIRRLGLSGEDIITAKIKASYPGHYHDSNTRSASSTESALFQSAASKTENSNITLTYGIANARHLFNATFEEETALKENTSRVYKQTKDFSWCKQITKDNKKQYQILAGEEGTGDNKKTVYYTYQFIDKKHTPIEENDSRKEYMIFRSFGQLQFGNTYDGNKKTITGLYYSVPLITKTKANESINADYREKYNNLGFAKISEGTIQNLTLKSILVKGVKNETVSMNATTLEGIDNVGAFCGILQNGGQLLNCKVDGTDDEPSQVFGRQNVGGLAGKLQVDIAIETEIQKTSRKEALEGKAEAEALDSCENNAAVVGWTNVGGILGSTDKTNNVNDDIIEAYVVISNCKNNGTFRGPAVNEDSNENTEEASTVSETNNENNSDEPEDVFCLGGIVGYCTDITISNCESKPEIKKKDLTFLQNGDNGIYFDPDSEETAKRFGRLGNFVGGIAGISAKGTKIENCSTKEDGYVIGKNFVGGIAGYHDGVSTNAEIKGNTAKNSSYVIGKNFVGGIAGANAKYSDIVSMIKDDTISKWLQNKITGDNTNSTSKIEEWKNEGIVVATDSYAGGITGYNSGTISKCQTYVGTANDEKLQIMKKISNLLGSKASYVGGLAGYNKGKIEGYSDTNSDKNAVTPVLAGEKYVGGLVGYQDAEGTLQNYAISGSNKTVAGGMVKGKYFVGGVIGINFSQDTLKQTFKCKLKDIQGDYFVGGIIGANFAVVENNKNDLQLSCAMDNFLGTIRQTKETAEGTNATNEGAFTGGFVGANALLSKNDANSQVNTLAFSNAIMDKLTNRDLNFSQKVTKVVSLLNESSTFDNNSNLKWNATSEMVIKPQNSEDVLVNNMNSLQGGVYVGGIVGYNNCYTNLTLERIQNTTAITANKSIQDSSRYQKYFDQFLKDGKNTILEEADCKFSYAGGIIGIVSDHTELIQCSNAGQGKVNAQGTFYGTLAEINEGTITRCDITTDPGNQASQNFVGGIVSINGLSELKDANGNRTLAVIQGSNVSAQIQGDKYVGGITALNYGEIKKYQKESDTVANTITKASITGNAGYVGGIAGLNAATGKISDVEIQGDFNVTALQGKHVGGIIGENQAPLSNVQSITNAENAKNLTIIGKQYVGGIIGTQSGSESASEVSKNLENKASVVATNGYAGGIIGYAEGTLSLKEAKNYGAIEARLENHAGGITSVMKSSESVLDSCENYGDVRAKNGYAGGLVSNNSGTIKAGKVEGTDSSKITISGKEIAGGFCAINTGKIIANEDETQNSINNLSVETIKGSKAEKVGGFVGVNGQSGENTDNSNTVIESCKVDKSSNVTVQIQAMGSSIGGVAGVNYGTIGATASAKSTDNHYDINIQDISLEVNKQNGNVGGIAGQNYETIQNARFVTNYCDENKVSDMKAKMPSFIGGEDYGYGGIAGRNENNAVIQNIQTMVQMQIQGDANAIASMGGIAGINGEGASVSNGTILTGTYLEATVNAYLGGAVGLNMGSVTDVKADKTKADKTNDAYDFSKWYEENRISISWDDVDKISKENDNNKPKNMVYLITPKGHVGGIVGMMGNVKNKELGLNSVVTDCSTGKNWYILSKLHATDNTAGGIIGYSYSTKNLKDLTNYATVVRKGSGSNSAAGIIGRWENEKGKTCILENAVNHGIIDGQARCSGMIGQVKYNGLEFKNCINYGDVYAVGSEGSSGLLGEVYGATSGMTFTFEKCRNYGNIYNYGTQIAAGFVTTNSNPENNSKFVFKDCVNFGDIYVKDGNVACAGFIYTGNMPKMEFEQCRNYGFGYNLTKGGFYSEFYGFTAKNVENNITMYGCYGISNQSGNGLKALGNSNKAKQEGKNFYCQRANETNVIDDPTPTPSPTPGPTATPSPTPTPTSTPTPSPTPTPEPEEGVMNHIPSAELVSGTLLSKGNDGYDDPEKLFDNIVNTSDGYATDNHIMLNRYGIQSTSGQYQYNNNNNNPLTTLKIKYDKSYMTNGIEIHFSSRNARRVYYFKVYYKIDDSSQPVYLNESNIGVLKSESSELVYNEQTKFVFYQEKGDTGSEDCDAISTAYFNFSEKVRIFEIGIEFYGVATNWNDNLMASGSTEYIVLTEIALSNWTYPQLELSPTPTPKPTATPTPSPTPMPTLAPGQPQDNGNVENRLVAQKYSSGKYVWQPTEGSDYTGMLKSDEDISVTKAPREQWNALDQEVIKFLKKAAPTATPTPTVPPSVTPKPEEEEKKITKFEKKQDNNTPGGFKLAWDYSIEPAYSVIELKGKSGLLYTAYIYNPNKKELLVQTQAEWVNEGEITATITPHYSLDGENDIGTPASCTFTIPAYLQNAKVNLRLVNLEKGADDKLYQVVFANYYEYKEYCTDSSNPFKICVQTGNTTKWYAIYYEEELKWRWQSSSENGSPDQSKWKEMDSDGYLKDAEGKSFINTSHGENEAIKVQVVANVEKTSIYSEISQVQSTAPKKETFTNSVPAQMNSWKSAKLQGLGRGEQSFTIGNIGYQNYQNRLRGEFLVKQTIDGKEIPVVVSTAEIDLSGFSTNLTMEFKDLPEDFNSYAVRTYPMAGKNGTVVYGYYLTHYDKESNTLVKNTYSEEDLKTNSPIKEILNNDNYQEGDIEKAGYVIESAGEKEYYLFYSELFKVDKISQTQVQYFVSAKTNTKTSWTFIQNRTTPTNLQMQQKIGDDTVTFSWQMPTGKNTEADAKTWKEDGNKKDGFAANDNTFEFILTGDIGDGDGNKVEIYRSKLCAETNKTYENYYSYKTDFSGFVTEITTYSITLDKETTALWKYKKIEMEVICEGNTGIVKVGGTNTTQLIWMPSLSSDENPKTFTYQLPLDTLSAPVVTSPSDTNNLVYTVSWNGVSKEQEEHVAKYQVGISTSQDEDPDSNVDGTIINIDGYQTLTYNDLDLEKYQGKTVYIKIRAIAKTDDDDNQYTNSAWSNGRDVAVVSRLPMVDSSRVNVSPSYEEHTSISEETLLTEGLTLYAMTSKDDVNDDRLNDAAYEFDAYISDTDPSVSNSKWNESASWDNLTFSGSMLKPDQIPNVMDASYRETILTGFSRENAGQYLCIRMRTKSQNDISSAYSYAVVQIPRVQVNYPELTTGRESLTLSGKNGNSVWSGEGQEGYNAERKTVSWEENTAQAYDGYQIQVYPAKLNEKETETVNPITVIVKKSGNGYTIQQGSQAAEVAFMTDNACEIPFTYNYYSSDGNIALNPVSLNLKITTENDITRYTLTLPDFTYLNNYQTMSTASVLVQTIMTDSTKYANSKYNQWMNVKNAQLDKNEYKDCFRVLDTPDNWANALVTGNYTIPEQSAETDTYTMISNYIVFNLDPNTKKPISLYQDYTVTKENENAYSYVVKGVPFINEAAISIEAPNLKASWVEDTLTGSWEQTSTGETAVQVVTEGTVETPQNGSVKANVSRKRISWSQPFSVWDYDGYEITMHPSLTAEEYESITKSNTAISEAEKTAALYNTYPSVSFKVLNDSIDVYILKYTDEKNQSVYWRLVKDTERSQNNIEVYQLNLWNLSYTDTDDSNKIIYPFRDMYSYQYQCQIENQILNLDPVSAVLTLQVDNAKIERTYSLDLADFQANGYTMLSTTAVEVSSIFKEQEKGSLQSVRTQWRPYTMTENNQTMIVDKVSQLENKTSWYDYWTDAMLGKEENATETYAWQNLYRVYQWNNSWQLNNSYNINKDGLYAGNVKYVITNLNFLSASNIEGEIPTEQVVNGDGLFTEESPMGEDLPEDISVEENEVPQETPSVTPEEQIIDDSTDNTENVIQSEETENELFSDGEVVVEE